MEYYVGSYSHKNFKVGQEGIKKSKYHKNTSEINELERDLIPVKSLTKILNTKKVRVNFQTFFLYKKKTVRE